MLAEIEQIRKDKLARLANRQNALGTYLSRGHTATYQARCAIEVTRAHLTGPSTYRLAQLDSAANLEAVLCS
jgi:hypothetical protein